VSHSTSYFAARRPLIEGPGEIDSGAWPISWFRIAKGWGQLPEAFWPDPKRVDGVTFVPSGPPNADEIAKRDRLKQYQRVRTEAEVLYAVLNNRLVTTSVEIGRTWNREHAVDGRISMLPDDEVLGVHSVSPLDIEFDDQCFVFRNTWGEDWGRNGWGFLPFGHLDKFMTEGWTANVNYPPTQPTQPGLHSILLQGEPSRLGATWIVEVLDGDKDNLAAWALIVQKVGRSFDVEEFFVRPDYRRQGIGTRLAYDILDALKKVKTELPIQFWIPWGDHCEHNAESLLGWAKALGLRLEPSGVRWAAYRASAGQPVDALPRLRWIPDKATSALQELERAKPEPWTVSADFEWNDELSDRRAELVEKMYSCFFRYFV
jgi:GNAT superfamily N-acetyltransferase